MLTKTYRIYSRLSREILDKFWKKYYQFDLYAGQTFLTQKYILVSFSYIIGPMQTNQSKLYVKNDILVNFWHLFFQFDLYAGQLIREYIR
jgi:hypothetical protein